MSRVMPWCVIALVPFVISADDPPTSGPRLAANVQNNVVEESQCAKAVKTLAKLRRPLAVKAIEVVPLRDVLKILSEASDVDFVVNLIPFREAGLERVEEQPVRLPALRRNLTIEETLNLVLPQLNGAFVIRGDYVEITTPKAKLVEFYSNWQFRTLFPGGPFETGEAAQAWDPNNTVIGLVHVDYTNAPFDKVVRDIAAQAGVNVMIAADEQLVKRNVDAPGPMCRPILVSASSQTRFISASCGSTRCCTSATTNAPRDLKKRMIGNCKGRNDQRRNRSIDTVSAEVSRLRLRNPSRQLTVFLRRQRLA